MLYPVGLLYLSASTNSIISSTKLVFNMTFSYSLILRSSLYWFLFQWLSCYRPCLLVWNDQSQLWWNIRSLNKEKWDAWLHAYPCRLAASVIYSPFSVPYEAMFPGGHEKEIIFVAFKLQIYEALVAPYGFTMGNNGGLWMEKWKVSVREDFMYYDFGVKFLKCILSSKCK